MLIHTYLFIDFLHDSELTIICIILQQVIYSKDEASTQILVSKS